MNAGKCFLRISLKTDGTKVGDLLKTLSSARTLDFQESCLRYYREDMMHLIYLPRKRMASRWAILVTAPGCQKMVLILEGVSKDISRCILLSYGYGRSRHCPWHTWGSVPTRIPSSQTGSSWWSQFVLDFKNFKAALCFLSLPPVEDTRKNIACSTAQTIAHDLCGV